jgi:hypothetical protein
VSLSKNWFLGARATDSEEYGTCLGTIALAGLSVRLILNLPWIENYGSGQNTKILEETMRINFLQKENELIDCTESDVMEDPIADVFLKDGKVARIPLSQVDQFLENNKYILESRKIKLPGPRRKSEISSNT